MILLPVGGDLKNFNIGFYSVNIADLEFWLRDMTNMDDNYILMGHSHAWMISIALGWGISFIPFWDMIQLEEIISQYEMNFVRI